MRLLLSIWKEPVIAEKIAAKSKEVCVKQESCKDFDTECQVQVINTCMI